VPYPAFYIAERALTNPAPLHINPTSIIPFKTDLDRLFKAFIRLRYAEVSELLRI